MRSDLIARYREQRLPRYTSYPTAPHFSEAVTHETYERWLAAVPPGTSGSLYLHVPFCPSMCWYCGCHTTITRREAPVLDYLATLHREIDLVAGRPGHPLPVRHVHFGGGTPTVMAPEALVELVAHLSDRFPFATDAQIAVEIDPRTLTEAMISALAAAGVTRTSIGVQSLDLAVQRAVNRVQDFDLLAEAVTRLRRAGIPSVSFDLIYGLPHQTAESCIDTVRQCITLRPDRFAVFGYAHVPTFKKHQRKIDEAALGDGSARQAQTAAIASAMAEAGYVPIGIDHYALPEDEMAEAQREGRLRRNFQGYTTDRGDILIGLGASAIGRLPQGYVQNEVPLRRYAERIARGELATVKGHALTRDDRLRGEVIERLMCDFRVDVAEPCRRYGIEPETLLRGTPRLEQLAGDELVRLDGSVLSVADDARFAVRGIAAAFDAYLGSSNRLYSRAL